jgi:hypothetical protein
MIARRHVLTTAEIALNNTSPYKNRGALRVGAWKPVSTEQALQEAVDLAKSSDGKQLPKETSSC